MYKEFSIILFLLSLSIVLIHNNPINEILAIEYVTKKPFSYQDPINLSSEKLSDNSNLKEHKNKEIIKNNLLTYYNQTMNLKVDYPDYWEAYTIGNESLAIIPPLNFSGMMIKILNPQNIDELLYERITLQKKTLKDFHLIYTYNIPSSLNDKESEKAVIMYLANDGSGFLKAVEIMFNYENKNTYHISFVSNSTIFDTLAPAVNQILNSITILKSENDYVFDSVVEDESKNTESKLSSQSDSMSETSSDYNTMSNSNKINSILSIPMGAATPGNPSYEPPILTVSTGDIVTVRNNDSVPHTVTSGTGPEDPESAVLFDSGSLMGGSQYSIPAKDIGKGDFPYYCRVHPFMTGTLTIIND